MSRKKIKKIQEMFQGWFSNSESNYNAFIKAMLRGNVKEMNTYMNEVALATFSSFDTGRHPAGKRQPERFYHGFVLGLLVELRDRYEVKFNRESGYGRYDVMLIPRETLDQAIIKKEEATSKSLLPFFVLLQNFKIHHCFFQNFLCASSISVRGALRVPTSFPIMLRAALTGIGFTSQKRASTSGSASNCILRLPAISPEKNL